MIDKKSVENARLLYYSILSKLFCFSYNEDRFDGVLDGFKMMANSSLDGKSEEALKNLISNVDNNYENISKEYDNIFHAPPSPVRSTISYYDEGYETGVACVEIKRLLAKTNIRRDKSKFIEFEDNFGFIFTIMSKFIELYVNGKDEYKEFAQELFEKYINNFVDEFLDAVYMHEKSNLYKDVVGAMSSFFEFERVYYGITSKDNKRTIKVEDGLLRSEALRRENNKARKNKGV